MAAVYSCCLLVLERWAKVCWAGLKIRADAATVLDVHSGRRSWWQAAAALLIGLRGLHPAGNWLHERVCCGFVFRREKTGKWHTEIKETGECWVDRFVLAWISAEFRCWGWCVCAGLCLPSQLGWAILEKRGACSLTPSPKRKHLFLVLMLFFFFGDH